MTLVLLGVGTVLLLSPRWLSPLGRRLHPRERVRLGVMGFVLGAIAVELALVLLALPTVAHAFGVDALAAACRRWLGDLSPGGLKIGWSAAALAVISPLLGVRAWHQANRAAHDSWWEPTFGVHSEAVGIDLVRLPTEAPFAYSLDGDRAQLVITDGLVELLSEAELDLVIGHERAHIRHRDGRTLRWLAAITAPLPVLHWMAQPIRVAIERAADEEATGDNLAQRTRLVDALVRVAAPDAASVAAFTGRSPVIERVAALLDAPPSPTRPLRMAAYSAVITVGTASVAVMAGWALEAHMMLSMVGICRM